MFLHLHFPLGLQQSGANGERNLDEMQELPLVNAFLSPLLQGELQASAQLPRRQRPALL